MSSHASIGVEIRVIASLIQSLIDLNAQYRELSQMKTCGGKIEKVDVVVKDPNGRDIGFQKTEKGDYRVVCDSDGLDQKQLKKQRDFVKQVRQRYAYNKVLDELKNQGYIIAEEQKVQDNTIRIVARKWS
ncbi:MAG: DUF1257 domain-containing protein [Deltaproteobacteria bacterium]